MKGMRQAQFKFSLDFPPSLRSRKLNGMLHTPKRDLECEIPDSNSGTVTVEATVDPVTGKHHLVEAWASSDRVNQHVLDSFAKLVCNYWSSDPLRFPDGTQVDLPQGESIILTVAFPIRAAAARSR